MLHAKFQGNWISGSGGRRFLNVFTIYGHGGHLFYKLHKINFLLAIGKFHFSFQENI